jgi:hypothetical protein
MNTTLNEYVTRYYVSWLKYTYYLCNLHGLRSEAYDIFSGSLLDLLTKSAEVIDGLLACEAQGDRKLLYYTKKIILYNVLQFKARGLRCLSYAGDSHVFDGFANTTTDAADDALLDCDEAIYNATREIEANFRDDSFIEPAPALDLPVKRDIKVRTSVFVNTPQAITRKDGTVRIYMPIKSEVYYTEGGVRKTKTKHFTSRGEAWMWARQRKAEILAGVLTL